MPHDDRCLIAVGRAMRGVREHARGRRAASASDNFASRWLDVQSTKVREARGLPDRRLTVVAVTGPGLIATGVAVGFVHVLTIVCLFALTAAL
jgi:hypothetical protein